MTTSFSTHSQFKERRSPIQQRNNQRPLSRLELAICSHWTQQKRQLSVNTTIRQFSVRHGPEPLPSAFHPKFCFNCPSGLKDWFFPSALTAIILHAFLASPISVTSSAHRGPHSVKVTMKYDVHQPRGCMISWTERGRKRSRFNRGNIPAFA